ncbi:MAG: response regulator [Bryobacteraceae bacterium]
MPIQAPIITAEILLLEPNAEEAALIAEAVEENRITTVDECTDILAFLRREGKYASAPRPDLVLLDLDLSRAEDCLMLSALKREPQFKRIPVVVLASSISYEDIFQAYDLHANAYICKPADRDDFLRVLRATLHFWLSLARLPKD